MRFRRARGRFFTTDYEIRRIDLDLEALQQQVGTSVPWFFYDAAASEAHDIYSEGSFDVGRRWRGPVVIPVLSAYHIVGELQPSPEGEYNIDTVRLVMSFEQARKAGLRPDLVLANDPHLRDRFIYDDRVFSVEGMVISGQFDPTGRDLIVQVNGAELRADELVNDPDFYDFAPEGNL